MTHLKNLLKMDYKAEAERIAQVQRKDAAYSAFLSRELEALDERMFHKLYTDLEFMQHLPSSVTVHPGAQNYTYQMLDRVGEATAVSDYSMDLPTVDVSKARETSNIAMYGSAYWISEEELAAAQMSGLALESEKAMAARRALEERLNSVILLGDSARSIQGLFNLSALSSTYSKSAFIGDATASWSNSNTTDTGAEIAQDMVAFCNKVQENSKGKFKADKLILPNGVYNDIKNRPLDSANPNKSVFIYVQEAHPGMQIVPSFFLDTAAANGSKRAMVMSNDPDAFQKVLPVPAKMVNDEVKPMAIKRGMIAKTGGAICRFSVAGLYADDV